MRGAGGAHPEVGEGAGGAHPEVGEGSRGRASGWARVHRPPPLPSPHKISAAHSEADIDAAVRAFIEVGRAKGVIN